MIVKWFGHASFLIKTVEKIIYIDPYAGEYVEKADVILLTHCHRDHADVEKIDSIQQEHTIIITSYDCARDIEGTVISLAPDDKKEIHGVTVEAVEAYNYKRFRSPGVPFHPKGTQIGFVLSAEGKRVYHAGDTDFIPEMRELTNIDIALLPTGGTFTMDVEEAIEATLTINPKRVIPMHRRDENIEEFKTRVEAKSDIAVLAIEEGDTTEL
jgi:L-ascorbate metabolism protein UlaG (beta-lactamase superfamily)